MAMSDKRDALDTALLESLAPGYGVPLDRRCLDLFERLAIELVAQNRVVNLTRITEPDEIAVLHMLDSLVSAPLIDRLSRSSDGDSGPRLVDIGAGAGMPGLPLAIARPDWQVALLESSAKATAFLARAIEALELRNATVIRGRAESVGREPEHRERYDIALARAVARLSVIVEYALPLLRVGGHLVAYKGSEAAAEAEAAAPALAALGGSVVALEPYELRGLDRPRHLVAVRKDGPTPPDYPRREGVAKRAPLEAPSPVGGG